MKQVVLGFFPSEAEAEAAAAAVKAWDEANDEVRFDAVGVLALDAEGKVKTEKLGKRSVGTGAGIGIALAALTPVGLGAVVAGGVLGALRKKDLGVTEEQRQRIGAELANGRAAVGVLATSAYEAGLVNLKLKELGAVTDEVTVDDSIDSESARVGYAQSAVEDRQAQARGEG